MDSRHGFTARQLPEKYREQNENVDLVHDVCRPKLLTQS